MNARARDVRRRAYVVTYSRTALVFGATPNTARAAVQRLHSGAIVHDPVPAPAQALSTPGAHDQWIVGDPEEEQGFDVSLTRRELETVQLAIQVWRSAPAAEDIARPLSREGEESELEVLVDKLDEALADAGSASEQVPATPDTQGSPRVAPTRKTRTATQSRPDEIAPSSEPVRPAIKPRQRWADLVRNAMNSTRNPSGALVTLRQLSKAVGASYERCRSAIAGTPNLSRNFSDRVAEYLGLDAEQLWRAVQAEKLQKKFGPALARIPRDTRLADLWEQLGDADRARLLHIGEAFVMAATMPEKPGT